MAVNTREYIAANVAARQLGLRGAHTLFTAHVRGNLTLTGRRIDPASGKMGERQQIPREYFADAVRLYYGGNEIGPKGRVPFHLFERNLALQRWSEVMLTRDDFARLKKSIAGRKYSSSAAETACRKWLIADLKSATPSANKRPDFLKLVFSKFPGISEKAFDRCWDIATAESGRKDLNRPGRKRKSPPL